MAKIFISYSSRDWSFVRQFIDAIHCERPNDIWVDRRKVLAGDVIASQISNGLAAADVFCLVLSPHAAKSRWVELELSAAIHRRSQEQHFRIVPVLYRSAPMPALIGGLHYLDFRGRTPVFEHPSIGQLHQVLACAGALGPAVADGHAKDSTRLGVPPSELSAVLGMALNHIAQDRFAEDDMDHKKGGWSRSYAERFHALAFPGQAPRNVAAKDSLTVTHWVVRGLHSVYRIASQRRLLKAKDVILIETLLREARDYLHRHFHRGKAGLWYVKSQGDLFHRPHVRHNATFAKALVQYTGEQDNRIKSALSFVLKCSRDPNKFDHRIPTHVEILACIELLRWHPEFRSRGITPESLATPRRIHEKGLLSVLHAITTTDPGRRPPSLFFDPPTRDTMALYYTWWALDAYGSVLLYAKSAHLRQAAHDAIEGILSFEQHPDKTQSAFPLTSGGPPDVGATAQIAEVLYRLDPRRHAALVNRCLQYIVSSLPSASTAHLQLPYTLWALFLLVERILYDDRSPSEQA